MNSLVVLALDDLQQLHRLVGEATLDAFFGGALRVPSLYF
jgi:hypothetical protein